ncbi:hypothetical protein HN371_28390 [Candidatus Poribacteria bacterium]|nr:hypothetical protein [Candidatus Poribacteria bacterium]MBT5532203.1 hypothetical protein [Candidatus Poribacteria bacterium]MBT7806890.1 hypothetical protein [Candidatus Poribacteria bacterium]
MSSPSIDIGDRVLAAVAQRPFVSGGNWFCTLIPICDLDGSVLSDDLFPNRGLIWWRVIEPVREHAVPRNLIVVHLEAAPAYDNNDGQKDYYQVGSVSPLKSLVNEIIPITAHADADSLIRAGSVSLDRPVRGAVYFRTGDEVTGPWKGTEEEEASGRRTLQIKAVQKERVWRWQWDAFERLVNVIHRDVKIVTDWHWGEFDLQSYTLVFQEDLKRAFEDAELVDALSDRDVVSKLARATVTHAERREIQKFFKEGMVTAEETEELRRFRPRMEGLLDHLEGFEEQLRPLLGALLSRDELRPALERRQEELAREYVSDRLEEFEAKVHEEITGLIEQRDSMNDEIQRTRETFADDKRAQEADLRRQREEHKKSLEEQRKESEQREREAVKLLDNAAQKFEERRSEVLQDVLEIVPLLREVGALPTQAASTGNGTALRATPPRRELELPPFVQNGVPKQSLKEEDFLSRWTDECRDAGYSFSESDLLNYHVAMKSERFNVLAGPSGIGKSTLPRLYSLALQGAVDEQTTSDRFLQIPVRPGWMDARDLLGYFNSLEDAFQPSPSRLFEYLVYAYEEEQRGTSGIYVVNLDEINLSYVEHYFADFLSALQSPEDQQAIQCFYPDLCREDDPYRAYGLLPIARSVRFVGTANIDETTKPFSPRLLDRVNVVELQIPAHLGLGGVEPESIGRSYVAWSQAAPVSAATYREWTVIRPPDAARALVFRAVEPLQKILHQYGYPISPRVMRAMVRYVANANEIVAEKEAIDRQILQRVLPKLRGHTERFREMLQELLMHMPEEEYPRSQRRLARMSESEYAMDFFHCIQEG